MVGAPLPATQSIAITFRECAERYIRKNEQSWRNPKYAQQWRNTLAAYVYPFIGERTVDSVSDEEVLSILQSGWDKKNETFCRLQNRLKQIFDWASSIGLRSAENPARWKGNLDQHLRYRDKRQVKPLRYLHPALMSGFMEALSGMPGMAALCLTFVALTLCKVRHARFATWNEIDFERRVWTVPIERNYQSKRPFEVYLSDEAMQTLEAAKHYVPRLDDLLIFPSPTGKPFCGAALSAVLKRTNVDAVPDGFRTTFAEWFQENDNYNDRILYNALGLAPKELSPKQRFNLTGLEEKTRAAVRQWSGFCMRDVVSASVMQS